MDASDEARRELHALVHEVNGAIFVIRGNAELGLANADRPEALERHLTKVMERCDQLAATLRQQAMGFPPDESAP